MVLYITVLKELIKSQEPTIHSSQLIPREEPWSLREDPDKEVYKVKNMGMRPRVNSCTQDQTNQGQDQ